MNKYELHERATALADSQSAYSLARRVVEFENEPDAETAINKAMDAIGAERTFSPSVHRQVIEALHSWGFLHVPPLWRDNQ